MIQSTTFLRKEILQEKFNAADELVWIPATKEEFWSLIELQEFRIEYFDNQIVGTVNYCSLNQATILDNFSWLFNTQFDRDVYNYFGSNRPVFVEKYDAVFVPSFHVVEGNIELHYFRKEMTATANPSVIIEVFPDSTKKFDLNEKLPCYKTIPSLQDIIFVEQNKPNISVFTRTKKPNEWLNTDYKDLNQKIRILGKYISLQQVYDKVIFKAKQLNY